MSNFSKLFLKPVISIFILLLIFSAAGAQNKSEKVLPKGKAVMWERVNIAQRDLFYGPGGKAMMPDLSKITFIKEENQGHNKKYRIKDGSGRIWVAKFGREAQPETAAVRLLWALGYKTEINYLVPSITIPGKGTFKNVRLEARPDEIERLDEWQWKNNPFVGKKELQGLKIMQVFITNWDVLDLQNKILEVGGENGTELHYIISDLGSTFGKLGNNDLPIFYRLGRKTNKPSAYVKTKLVRDVKDRRVVLSYKGKNRGLFKDISIADAEWLSGLLSQLSDKQIKDAFRAANYSSNNIETLTKAVKNKIAELSRVSRGERLAAKSL